MEFHFIITYRLCPSSGTAQGDTQQYAVSSKYRGQISMTVEVVQHLHKQVTTSAQASHYICTSKSLNLFHTIRPPYLLLANYKCIKAPGWLGAHPASHCTFVRGYSSWSVKLNGYALAELRLRFRGSLLVCPCTFLVC